ncbi:MAG: GvpL/GvpF family gas vesicle protein [Gemmatimonadota bacterium]|nr:GvpL/GvpF family gas vesicle protein [Gemmatimonadota bacterium]
MASAPPKALRFYGVVDADSVDQELLSAHGVSLITYRELGALVARASYVRVKLGDAELQDFVRVVDALCAAGPVVPAPPGTVFRDERVLSRWLDIHYAKLHEALSLLDQRDDGRAPYDFVRMELGA